MKFASVIALCLTLAACGGGGNPAPQPPSDAGAGQPESCTLADQRQSLSAWMNAQYYWYAQLSPPDASAADMDGYFRSMLYKPVDRFSFTEPTSVYEGTFLNGYKTGYGYALAWADASSSQLRVQRVELQGPAAAAGIRRGDTVLSIDGFTPAQIAQGAVGAVDTAGVPRVFRLQDAAGAVREVTVNSAVFPLTPIAAVTTFDATRGGQPVKVGYMAYHQFVGYSAWDLALRTQQLAQQGVGEMILDLRYNGGGSVTTSRDLSSMISGSQTDGKIFTSLRYNDRQTAQNQDIPFMTAQTRYTQPIEGLSRVFVITSAGTASASELLINGLKPFMKVVLVGETTYGKPYGFLPRSSCGTTYNAVQFEAFNSAGVGGYTQGLPADCPVADDLDHDLGDANERRTRVALNYIATGSCGQVPQSAALLRGARARALPSPETVREGMFLD